MYQRAETPDLDKDVTRTVPAVLARATARQRDLCRRSGQFGATFGGAIGVRGATVRSSAHPPQRQLIRE